LISLAAYAADVALHSRGLLLNWYDLGVYHHAGLIARHDPATLYSWQLRPGIRFTYTPFAAVAFAAGSLLPLGMLHWLMTAASLAALAVTGWLTLGALGWPGRRRVTGALAIAALALWTEPVLRALQLGQIELVLLALVVWDLCQPDERRWKGAGVGLAAGIKLVPLIFIPYLILAGKFRQAAVAAAAFGATVAAGFALLPRPSEKWWLSGYFLHPGNVGDVGSLVNQSPLAVITRAMGSVRAATPVWLAVAALITVAGLAAAALLDRSGRPVEGWITCALTGLLVSPVSWDHHWVWIVPVLVLVAARAVAGRGARRWACWALLAAVAALFGGWPDHWTGPLALVPDGLLGFFVGPHPVHEIYHLHGFQLISWNLFVVGGLAMFAVALAAAARLAAGRGRLRAKMPVAGQ
jgi:alpha-1,2-mannosyltransferase